MKWDFVIKVKHGDTLRRLGGHVDGKLMDYTINKLRNKIISLFKFNDDADLILTYTDIDGDIVTLDNDDELRDAVIGQRLNPIRISVHLKSKSDTSSSAASLPSKTSSVASVLNSISDTQKPVFAGRVDSVDMAQPFLDSPADLSNSNQSELISSGSTSTKPSVVSANPMNQNIAYESIWSHFPTPFTNEKIDSVTRQNDSTVTGAYAFGYPKPTPVVSTDSPAEGGNISTSNEAPKVSFEQINQHPPQYYDLRGFHVNDLGKRNTIHRDVQRDIWGPYPIVGPSFLSIPKGDHVQGTEYAKHWSILSAPIQFQHGCHNEYKRLQQRSNLDSVFVKDMTVLDGTVMPPSTHFIKTWKMRNSGTANWPCGTQLVWVGGHCLGHKESFTLEQIPACGLPVGAEFDVTVGFSAPSKPGRYVSYWRLQCPSLRKFGQRVWVDFEVKDYNRSSINNFNLNLPPKNNHTQSTGKENSGININTNPVSEEGSTEATKRNTSNNELADVTGDDEGVVKYDSVDPTLVADALANASDNSKVGYENSVEEDCLNELKDMGFKQVELNREVLRRNKYDLDLTVEDLCGFGQWDSLLAELHNMDFCDRELNEKMLVKNGGSLKRTVLDLLAENKE